MGVKTLEEIGAELSALVREKRGGQALRTIGPTLGISASTVCRIEKGQISDLETFITLCWWLDVSADELIGLKPEPCNDELRSLRRFKRRVLKAVEEEIGENGR